MISLKLQKDGRVPLQGTLLLTLQGWCLCAFFYTSELRSKGLSFTSSSSGTWIFGIRPQLPPPPPPHQHSAPPVLKGLPAFPHESPAREDGSFQEQPYPRHAGREERESPCARWGSHSGFWDGRGGTSSSSDGFRPLLSSPGARLA